MPVPEGAEYTVVVAHPADQVRTRVMGALAGADELSVVGQTTTGADTLERVIDEVPDAVLLAPAFEDAAAVEVIQAVRNASPVTVLVALLEDDPGDGSLDDEAYVLARTGVISSLRISQVDDAAAVVRGAIQGESLLPPRWAERAAEDLRQLEDEPLLRPARITSTEAEVLERLAKREDAADIAVEYDVEERLVNLHTGYAMAKLHWSLEELRHLTTLED